ncbi:MAG: hypothetical protein NVS1B7_8510 [Candidatus Saccharimonadales bacterium]
MTSPHTSAISVVPMEIPYSLHDSIENFAVKQQVSFTDCVKNALLRRGIVEDIRDGREYDPAISPACATESLEQNVLDAQLDLDSILSEGLAPMKFFLRLKTQDMAHYEQNAQKEGFSSLPSYTIGSLLFVINQSV